MVLRYKCFLSGRIILTQISDNPAAAAPCARPGPEALPCALPAAPPLRRWLTWSRALPATSMVRRPAGTRRGTATRNGTGRAAPPRHGREEAPHGGPACRSTAPPRSPLPLSVSEERCKKEAAQRSDSSPRRKTRPRRAGLAPTKPTLAPQGRGAPG